VHEGRRAAAVEVDRALGAQLNHRLGELEHSQPMGQALPVPQRALSIHA
jgi:hypothetical protein